MIESCTSSNQTEWLHLRELLWPDCNTITHQQEIEDQLRRPNHGVQFLARDSEQQAIGFIEASLRYDYVNGTHSSPVAFIEGLYVKPEFRRQSYAKALIDAVIRWAAQLGCIEIASDTEVSNTQSQAFHQALGFEETERVVFYRKQLK